MEPERILFILVYYLVLLFSLSVHESAHAWAALQQGDDTALREGRISLNPLVHIDLIGTVIFPLMGLFMGGFIFGWAKPTPMQPRNFRDFRWGQISSAGAGPVSNFLLALIFTVLYGIAIRVVSSGNPLVLICQAGIMLNVLLGVFNLLPVPPLDGSYIASWGLPRKWGDLYDKYMEPYGYFILIGLFVSRILQRIYEWTVLPVEAFLRGLVA